VLLAVLLLPGVLLPPIRPPLLPDLPAKPLPSLLPKPPPLPDLPAKPLPRNKYI
jgi:hypothetical protein